MVQIKLSVIFLLAAAAVAPVVAQPIQVFDARRRDPVPISTPPSSPRREYADELEAWGEGRHHHRRPYHHRHEGGPPADASTE